MKIAPTSVLYTKMFNAFKDVMEYHGGANAIKQAEQQAGLTRKRTIWDIWHSASDNLRYDDNHPRYRKLKRILPYDASFNLYEDDSVNDSHIETALNHIAKQLGL